jgi:hypothetical protein
MILCAGMNCIRIVDTSEFKVFTYVHKFAEHTCSLFGWLVTDDCCRFVLREEYCWLVAGGWFVLREKYRWLVTDKPSEQGDDLMVLYPTSNLVRTTSNGFVCSHLQGLSRCEHLIAFRNTIYNDPEGNKRSVRGPHSTVLRRKF